MTDSFIAQPADEAPEYIEGLKAVAEDLYTLRTIIAGVGSDVTAPSLRRTKAFWSQMEKEMSVGPTNVGLEPSDIEGTRRMLWRLARNINDAKHISPAFAEMLAKDDAGRPQY